jgi:hypothetical protein
MSETEVHTEAPAPQETVPQAKAKLARSSSGKFLPRSEPPAEQMAEQKPPPRAKTKAKRPPAVRYRPAPKSRPVATLTTPGPQPDKPQPASLDRRKGARHGEASRALRRQKQAAKRAAKRADARQAKLTDPLRLALSKAIAEAKLAHEVLDKRKAALAKLSRVVYGSSNRIEQAEKGIKEAEQAYDVAVEAAVDAGKPEPSPAKVEAARQALVAIRDQDRARRAAFERMQLSTKDLEADCRDADVAVHAAAKTVLLSRAHAWINKAEQMAMAAKPYLEVVSALCFASDRPSQWEAAGDYDQGDKPFKDIRERAGAVLSMAKSISRMQPDIWVEARKALQADAYAKLTELDAIEDHEQTGSRRTP